ncbi:MAG TPA: DUF488 domain-containing protein [Ktedonobacterales bacterium]|jgi:uncharacterized protein (DUF488 family)|nr:DUF488 domain-containing protein [Ktedonobacterales bacterium]
MSAGQPPEPETSLTIYSIGHSNQSLEAFIALLQRHGIQSLADVRSAPYSRYVPHFNRPELEYAVERAGIRYLYLGDELGGRPAGKEFYDDEGYVLYYRAARAPFFVRGLERLTDEGALYRTAIMCSEEDPTNCHRRLLIARVLEEQGVPTLHIRGDDRIQTADDFHRDQQLSLWDDPSAAASEERTWKSIRPVSPRRPPSNSSSLFDEQGFDDF